MSQETVIDQLPAPKTLDRVVIRFAGDSGDGMQLAGTDTPARLPYTYSRTGICMVTLDSVTIRAIILLHSYGNACEAI